MQILKIFNLLNKKEKKNFYLLLILIIVTSFFEVLSIGSIFPFLIILTNPEIEQKNFILSNLNKFFKDLGILNYFDFSLIIGLLFLSLILISIIFKLATSYFQSRFSYNREFNFAERLIKSYLKKPYSWFLTQDKTQLLKTIITDVNNLITGVLIPLLNILVSIILIFLTSILLFLFNFFLTIKILSVLFLSYIIIFFILKKYLLKSGKIQANLNEKRFISTSEIFNAIKEIKIYNAESFYIKLYSDTAKKISIYNTNSMTLFSAPRFILEVIIVFFIIFILIFSNFNGDSFYSFIPIFSVYLFAGYRLLPAFQQFYASYATIRFYSPILDNLIINFKDFEDIDEKKHKIVDKFSLNKSIVLKNISYQYKKSKVKLFQDLNFEIPAFKIIGIKGAMGSGKSTIIDIILGLIEPDNGSIIVDGKLLQNQNITSWQKIVGYVPQHIYLINSTVSENIAFATENKMINKELLYKASKIANIHEFITKELPESYDSKIGENGILLSGGQRQSLGIARAIYHQPQLLILDEATNAIDNFNEEILFSNLNLLKDKMTIILISHQINTLKKCDHVYNLEKSKLIKQQAWEK
jgi:ABC-type bacteriocin/lantibiotic exporter with double-glycine peptidase domain